MSRDKTMPMYLSRIHMEYFTPYAAILTLCAVAMISSILLTLLGGFDSFTYAVAGSEMMMYIMAALSVMKLRNKLKNHERPIRMPWYPLTAVFTAVLFGLLFVMVFFAPESEARIGFAIFFSIIGLMVLHTIFIIPLLRNKQK
jgi:amino acid transporter